MNEKQPFCARPDAGRGNGQTLSRRDALRVLAYGAATGLAVSALGLAPALAAPRVLTVFFSRTGNTRAVARQIQAGLGGQLVELKTTHSYPAAYRATTEQAKREQQERFRPVLTTSVEVTPFEVVCIGYPVWWGTLPMALFSFLEQHDFAGKTLAPFCTHAGSGLGRGPRDIAAVCPGSRVLDGLAVRGSEASGAEAEVARWLRHAGLRG